MFEDIRNLRLLHGRLTDLLMAASRPRAQSLCATPSVDPDKFLRTLRFHGMNFREEMISKTHSRTFEWLLLPQDGAAEADAPLRTYTAERKEIRGIIHEKLDAYDFAAPNRASFRIGGEETEVCPTLHLQEWLRASLEYTGSVL